MSTRCRFLGLIVSLCVCLLGEAIAPLGARADNQPFFVPDKIETFDGTSWAGVALARTTQDGIKKQFRTGRGDFSTSVLLEQDDAKNVPFRISALFVNKEKDATLDGICIKYKTDGDGIPLAKLQTALGGPGETRFPSHRFEDWKIVAYPERGVLLFVLGDTVPMLLLGHADWMSSAIETFPRTDMPAIEQYLDQFRDRERLLRFSDLDVSFSLKGISMNDQSREEREIRRDLRSATAGGYILYDTDSSGGSYHISVTAKYDSSKGGDGSVEASLQGKGPFGSLSSSHTETFKIDAAGDDRKLEDTRYNRALIDAMKYVERDMAGQVRRQQPPPVESVRQAEWAKLIDKYRFHSRPSIGGTHSLVD